MFVISSYHVHYKFTKGSRIVSTAPKETIPQQLYYLADLSKEPRNTPFLNPPYLCLYCCLIIHRFFLVGGLILGKAQMPKETFYQKEHHYILSYTLPSNLCKEPWPEWDGVIALQTTYDNLDNSDVSSFIPIPLEIVFDTGFIRLLCPCTAGSHNPSYPNIAQGRKIFLQTLDKSLSCEFSTADFRNSSGHFRRVTGHQSFSP